MPVAIKDDVDLAGHTTPFGCAGEHRPAERDAEPVRRLREAGAIVVGKTNAPEVGQWHFTETPAFGATRNPWNPDHTPGGSSGGAAAAVAAGIVPAAIGSDGAGSVRIPAAWSGLVGLKPQRGRISTWPDPEAFNGLTCFGPLTRTVADAALLLDVAPGNVPADLPPAAPPPAEPFAAAAARDPGPVADRPLLRHPVRRPRRRRPRAPGRDRGLRRAARPARPRVVGGRPRLRPGRPGADPRGCRASRSGSARTARTARHSSRGPAPRPSAGS